MSALEQELRSSQEARSVEARLLRRLLKILGDPPIAFVLWTGERVAAATEGLIGSVRLADRRTLLGLLRDTRVRFGDAYSEGRIEIEGDLVRMLEAVYRSGARNGAGSSALRR